GSRAWSTRSRRACARPVAECSPAVAALASLALWTACSSRVDPPPGASGEEIYALQNCANCHGERGEGRSLGPPLRELAASWTVADLGRYLARPADFIERDPRLRSLDAEYTAEMNRYDNLTDDERRVLAEWLLTL
ncbi:MAG: cytochrome c, partial [Myxococcota bacterium]